MAGPLAVSLTADISKYEAAMVRARDLAVRHSQDIAGNFALAATKINGAFAGIQTLSRLPAQLDLAKTAAMGLAGTGAAIFAAYATVTTAIGQANDQLDRFVKLGQNAEKAGVGVEFVQRFSEAAEKAKLDVQEIEAALKHAGSAVTPRFEQEDAIKKRLNELFETSYLGSFQSKALADYNAAGDNEARIRAAVEAMRELRDLGEQTAALDIAEKLFGADTADRIRSGRLDIEAIATALDRPRDDLVKQEEVDRANQFKEELDAAYKAIDDALHVSVSLAGAGQAVLDVWLKIVQATAEASKVAGGFLDKMIAAARIGDTQSPLAPRVRLPGEGSLGADLGADAGISARGRTRYAEPIGPEKPRGMIEDPPAPPRRPLSIVLDEAKVRPESPGRGSTGATSVDPVETFVNGLAKSTAALRAETEAFGLSNREKQAAIATAKAQEIASQNGTTLTEEQTARIREASTAAADYKGKLADLEQQQRQAAEAARYFSDALSNAFADAILEGKSFASILGGLEKMLARSALQAIFSGTGPLAGLFGTAPNASAGSNAVGGLAGLFGGGSGGSGVGLGSIASFFTGGFNPIPTFATGGAVSGPGGPTDDRVPAMLSHGEFVVNAAATARHRDVLEAINTGRVKRFADGGMVGDAGATRGTRGGPASVVSIAPAITINANGLGGDKGDHAALAAQLGKHVETSMRQIATEELRRALRPRGLLNQ